ncbi:type IV secretion pathway protein [Bosea sp. (in: a-proteobacteria)]|uniref:type IV secretion pathway protein n=1 Tax=Bosea sp. (in: a-proteobacteria) TaxID=1871050 RepID=UPI0027325626|nr:type IV secretion pathway protein [Bosea sp. (in: a-proteobacteria)]MDP3411025.1 type IV secretion pathway protein [Bosea sp. (in: a-proteobacteria)]
MNCRVIFSVVLAMTVTGCAGWNKGAPSCDGSAKRPLNRSLWDWEAMPPVAPQPDAPAVKRLGQARHELPARGIGLAGTAWSAFDIARSFRPCNEATRHG